MDTWNQATRWHSEKCRKSAIKIFYHCIYDSEFGHIVCMWKRILRRTHSVVSELSFRQLQMFTCPGVLISVCLLRFWPYTNYDKQSKVFTWLLHNLPTAIICLISNYYCACKCTQWHIPYTFYCKNTVCEND